MNDEPTDVWYVVSTEPYGEVWRALHRHQFAGFGATAESLARARAYEDAAFIRARGQKARVVKRRERFVGAGYGGYVAPRNARPA